MFVYNSDHFKLSIKLSSNDISFFHIVCNLGFASRSQLDMLYSISQGYPLKLPNSILQKWCQYSGLLHKRPKSKKASGSALTYPVYVPTPSCRRFLINIGIPLGKNPLVSLNGHNLEAIEVVVQGLYAAVFKTTAYGSNASSLIFNNVFKLWKHPEETFRIQERPDKNTGIS